jgi:hypothetical protein
MFLWNYPTITKSDISYAVSVVSQFIEVPRTLHWEAVIHILRYLKKFPACGILFKKGSLVHIGQDPLLTEDLLLGIVDF